MTDLISVLLFVVLAVLYVLSFWIVFAKADEPGWGCLVPIYNLYLMLRIAGLSGWWLVVFFIPVLNIIPSILMPIGIARNFEKGLLFTLGLMFLPFIFYPILAFSDAEFGG